jgi:hypothetical protein
MPGNGAEIAAARVELQTISLRIDNLTGNVTEARAALTRLNIIGQDVTVLRSETIAIRRDMDVMREEAAARHNELLIAIRASSGGAVPPA